MFFAIFRLLFTQFKQNNKPRNIGKFNLLVTVMIVPVLIRNRMTLISILYPRVGSSLFIICRRSRLSQYVGMFRGF